MTKKQKRRRSKALDRLDIQLATGMKPAKRSHPFHNRLVPLTTADKQRIRAEIATLEKRVVFQ